LVDKTSKIPYYIQIKNDLLDKINNSIYKTGEKIPTEKELSNLYEVSRVTIREAIKELSNENRIEVIKGKGMYIKPYILAPLMGVEKIASFSYLLSNKGLNFSIKILEQKKINTDDKISEKIGVNINSPVVFIERIRYIEDKPGVYTKAYLKYENCSGILNIDLEKNGLFHSIESILGISINNIKRIIEPSLSNEYQSKQLKIKKNSPIIYMQSFLHTRNNLLFCFIEDFFIKDFARFEFILKL
jgi:GntR family transcriptional regulator